MSKPKKEPEQPFKSLTEATEMLNLSRQSVWRNINRGVLLGYKVGNTYIIPTSEIQRLQKKRRSDSKV